MKNITLHIHGMHCTSCKILIEESINNHEGFSRASVDLSQNTVSFDAYDQISPQDAAAILSDTMRHHKYHFSPEKKIHASNPTSSTIWLALPIGLIILMLFFILQRSGILNVGFGQHITPFTSLFIGAIASLSTCLAVVGGLILSLASKIVLDDRNNTKVSIIFHISRLLSFALFGGILGLAGNAIGINIVASTLLGLLASVIMILLGINLTGLTQKIAITLPTRIFTTMQKIEHQKIAPILVGAGTFFLPCGFTQSMQIQALSTGSFFGGASIMFFFAIGTLPVLALISFVPLSFSHSRYAPLFFQTAGIVIIGLGLFTFLSGLVGLGALPPIFNI